jgi:hypothetical protein
MTTAGATWVLVLVFWTPDGHPARATVPGFLSEKMCFEAARRSVRPRGEALEWEYLYTCIPRELMPT